MSELADFLQKPEIKDFIQDHVKSDIQRLLLNPPTIVSSHIKEVIGQIQARQKAMGKLDFWAADFDLILPPPLSIEQASSEKTANYKKSIISGRHLIDLSGGMGVDCLALSENFKHTTYVEMQTEVAEVFKYNCSVLAKDIEVVTGNSLDYLEKLPQKPEKELFFYVDPARRDEGRNKVFKLADCSPNILEILPTLKILGKQVLVKLSPLLDIKSLLQQIPNIKELHVVSVKNDCKELLLLIDFSFDGETLIKTSNIGLEEEKYDFTFRQEQDAVPRFTTGGQFLLEPNASILKAGAFRKIGVDFGLSKVSPNTHLYSTSQIPRHWPGRIFEILEDKLDKKLFKRYATDGHINVLTRNHPLTAKELKNKYKIQDGGELFLIGFRDHKEKARLVVGKRC